MVARLSALHASRTLPPGFFIIKDSWYSFLLEAESTPGPCKGKVKLLITTPWRCMGKWSYSSINLNLSIRWRWVFSFTFHPLYPLGESLQYSLDRRLSGLQSQSGHSREEKSLLSLPWTDPPPHQRLDCQTCVLVTIQIELQSSSQGIEVEGKM
jgi:hypothetical protein